MAKRTRSDNTVPREPLTRNGAYMLSALLAFALACGGGGTTEPVDQLACTGRDTAKIPLNDLGKGCYLSFEGGLYPGGSNVPPAGHLAAGLSAARQVQPLDAAGRPSPTGRYVLLSIGMSNTTQEFCSGAGTPGSCEPWSFMGQAAADPAVNHTTLAIVNGAAGGRSASYWESAASPEFDRIRSAWLQPLGLSELQVQIVWVKVANPQPRVSLPDSGADAYTLVRQMGNIARALKARYPNLRQVYFSSRIYAGYATTGLNPEPYAYESGFAVKWLVAAQIRQMGGAPADSLAGSLRYDDGTAPWIAWGAYLWAAGPRPRSDGLTYLPGDFASDGTHPAQGARQKVGSLLLAFFKTAETSRCWFLAGERC